VIETDSLFTISHAAGVGTRARVLGLVSGVSPPADGLRGLRPFLGDKRNLCSVPETGRFTLFGH
jgi:hypothetical protein